MVCWGSGAGQNGFKTSRACRKGVASAHFAPFCTCHKYFRCATRLYPGNIVDCWLVWSLPQKLSGTRRAVPSQVWSHAKWSFALFLCFWQIAGAPNSKALHRKDGNNGVRARIIRALPALMNVSCVFWQNSSHRLKVLVVRTRFSNCPPAIFGGWEISYAFLDFYRYVLSPLTRPAPGYYWYQTIECMICIAMSLHCLGPAKSIHPRSLTASLPLNNYHHKRKGFHLPTIHSQG